ncbi:MAG: hypothetical protein C5B50_19205 [Verrucomicrobia bacterium]|nr:MAG: hypothetical protein C5B50_19205 [Verrucomicrobiota bacterium]
MDFQALIHKLEQGGGMRYFRGGLLVLLILMLGVGYNSCAFRNMTTQEAMDSAQLARNISQGKGFTTLFVRPFSMYLLKKRYEDKHGVPPLGSTPDETYVKSNHPDTANPPVYPVILAGLMKACRLNYQIPAKPKPFWSSDGRFWRYAPDFVIAVFNQILLLAVVVLIYLLARRLFDPNVAFVSALLLLGAELFWRFSVSGLSTMLLLLIFTGLTWVLVLIEEETREPRRGSAALLTLAAIAGALVGVGGMTRYSFGWIILPVLFVLALSSGRQRIGLILAAFLAFTVIMTPWLVRNFLVSGVPFGTSTYVLLEGAEGAGSFTNHVLQRSIEPDIKVNLHALNQKLLVNIRLIFQNDLPKLGGSWISAFFLVGLMVSFTSQAVRRLRYFLVSCLVVLILAQALGKTQLSTDSPEINSENLLVLLAPLVLIFGVSLFYVLLDQLELPMREIRYAIIVVFCGLTCLPLIFTFLPPRSIPVAYPPYYPPVLQHLGGLMKQEELMMSDIPWALAWYGQRQCVWLTENCDSDFMAINDYDKQVNAVYISPATLNGPFFSQLKPNDDGSWGNLVLQFANPRSQLDRTTELHLTSNPRFASNANSGSEKKDLTTTFPLRFVYKLLPGMYQEQFVLLDWERWRKTGVRPSE